MLKLHKSTMIGLYAMIEMAREPDVLLATNDIAKRFHVSVHHLAKVLRQLVRAGLVETTRGAAGGHRLARDPKNINLREIAEIFEGPRDQDALCMLRDPKAEHQHGPFCVLHPVMVELGDHIAFTLESISLKTIITHDRRMA